MQIKQELKQFKNHPTLIITAGKQHAIFYIALNGNIEKYKEIKIETPQYSDREGRFESRSKNVNLGSGSVYEDDAEAKVITDFINEIEEELKNIKDIKDLYYFCPDYMKNYLKKAIEKHHHDPRFFSGNYTDKHPFELIEKIQNK